MKKFKQLLISTALFACASSAQALIINFQTLADSVPGDSSHAPLDLSSYGVDVDIFGGSFITADAYAYLDNTNSSGKAGLGVCSDSSSNDCPSADSINASEYLAFYFTDGTTSIDKIWFNSNHGTDGSLLGDSVSLFTAENGTHVETFGSSIDSSFVNSDLGWVFDLSNWQDGNAYTETMFIDYVNENFYVSQIEFNLASVPEPSILALLGIGLIGAGVAKRRK